MTDVLNLGIVGSPTDYVHRAGRVGRVGQLSRGVVTSVLAPAEVDDLLALGRTLRFTPTEVDPPPLPPLFDASTLDSASPEEQRTPATDPYGTTEEDQWDDAVQQLEQVFFLKDADGGDDGDVSAGSGSE